MAEQRGDRIRWLLAAAACVLIAASACSPPGGDSAGCNATTCAAACRTEGHSGGSCVMGNCRCNGTGADGGGDAASDYSGPLTEMTGTVWSPGHVVPISGALVMFATVDPAPIPAGAYPETCVDPTGFFVRSSPDGTFALAVPPGTWRLVVQKGQFRRIRDVTVPESGPAAIDEELTTLPSDYGEGDTIPHIALLWALDGGDHIEDVLAKMQMGQLDSSNRLIRGTEHFDIYNVSPYPPNTDLLTNLDLMLSYHIIFFPCTIWEGFGDIQENDPTGPLSDPAVLDNLRAFANAGGKIYATDMMYDIFEQPMPVYVDECGDDATINAADEEAWHHSETAYGWTSHGQSVDDNLSAWLDAIGVGHDGIDFLENFVWIEGLYDNLDPLPGDPIPPKVWVKGDFILDPSRTLPLTITFPYGAGKVLFSTYHTCGDSGSSGHSDLYPQEKILIYLIMEIGVCQDPFI